MLREVIRAQLYACGGEGLPESLKVKGTDYSIEKVYKNDFFASTALYRKRIVPECDAGKSLPERVILKMARNTWCFCLPIHLFGKGLCSHEIRILKRLQGISNVPRLLEELGKYGFVYEYIEGCSLDEEPEKLPADFFARLSALLEEIHSRRVVYMDMNKRGNILLGSDGAPYIIDFQISLYLPHSNSIVSKIRASLCQDDIYHLRKHHRKFSVETMTPKELAMSYRINARVRIHRILTLPYKIIRRFVMKHLHKSGILVKEENTHYSPETDPERYANL